MVVCYIIAGSRKWLRVLGDSMDELFHQYFEACQGSFCHVLAKTVHKNLDNLVIWLMTCIINFLHEHNSSYSYIIQFHVSENSIHKVNFIDLVTFHPSTGNCTVIVHFVHDISSKCFTHLVYLNGEAYLTSYFVMHVVNFFF